MCDLLKRAGGNRARRPSAWLLILASFSCLLAGCASSTLIDTVVPPSTAPGAVSEFILPTIGGNPEGIAVAPDKQSIWFTEYNKGKIGKVSLDGSAFKEYPFLAPNTAAFALATGPDGNIWYTEQNMGKVGYITPQGKFK